MLQWMASYIYAHIRNTKYTKWVRKKEEQERRPRKWGRGSPCLEIAKGMGELIQRLQRESWG